MYVCMHVYMSSVHIVLIKYTNLRPAKRRVRDEATKLKTARGCDNVVPNQGYRTHQMTVIDECEEWWNDD
jgi:hypothetical protein